MTSFLCSKHVKHRFYDFFTSVASGVTKLLKIEKPVKRQILHKIFQGFSDYASLACYLFTFPKLRQTFKMRKTRLKIKGVDPLNDYQSVLILSAFPKKLLEAKMAPNAIVLRLVERPSTVLQ